MTKSEDTEREDSTWGWVVASVAIVLVLFAGYHLLIANDVLGLSIPEKYGSIGDSYGALNTLFSGLAFAVLIVALLLQKRELGLQREELKATRDELKGQKEQMRAQNEQLRQQTFENTFFKMLSLHHEIVSAISLEGMERNSKGRSAFIQLYKWLDEKLDPLDDRFPVAGEPLMPCDAIDTAFEMASPQLASSTYHYFRNLYHIVHFVDRREVDDESFYMNVVKAQLSENELKLLFLNCLGSIGRKKFKPLIEKHGLLEQLFLDQEEEDKYKVYKEEYTKSAFGNQSD